LLIDADIRMRSQSIRKNLGLKDDPHIGLVEIVNRSDLSPGKVIHRIDPLNLSVIFTGIENVAPYEILKSRRCRDILHEARRRYDYVIVDTPPVVPVSDCGLIEKLVDGFLMVVSAHQTPRRMLAEALEMIDHDKILGIVFNNCDKPLSHYYGYYGYYAQ
jgi:capsular exopolysaccharide synthesis family protein